MVKSMTGYGRGDSTPEGRTVTVEVRAVNNRYLDCAVKLPRLYLYAEDAIKNEVQENVSRGKVEVIVTMGGGGDGAAAVSVNRPLAESYVQALSQLREMYEFRDDITLSLLTRFPNVIVPEPLQDDAKQMQPYILTALRTALTDFNAMRAAEGARLAQDVLEHAETLAGMLALVEARAPGVVADYRARLEAKLCELLQHEQIDESRIVTEAAIFADKAATDEETVRLHSHLAQLCELLETDGAVGRKLDFLIQEFNREVNTIGSKSNDIETTRLVVDMKAEIEKIREQIQNIE
ncbi:MAG: YicC family protein [Oscillospiraceae bacterium]|nr:YicC family protein [Oscillospiraceae bacterium]